MTPANFQEHQDYYDWFVRTTHPTHIIDTQLGATRASHRNIGIILYHPIRSFKHSGVSFCYLMPGHPGWDLSNADLDHHRPGLSERLDYWSTRREAIIAATGIQNDLRQITILLAMLNYPPS